MEIYMDNAATTKPFAELAALYQEYANDGWQNPSSIYQPAMLAEQKMQQARNAVAQAAGAGKDAKIIFLSGGTEAANQVLFHGYVAPKGKKLHFISSVYEHPCVFECMKRLQDLGHDVDFVHPRSDGSICPEDVAALVREETALVSIMHVNNETGAVNPISQIARLVHQKNPGTKVHADGVQGFLKCPFAFDSSDLDYYTLSGHKIHALKGTGALIAKKDAKLKPLLLGGGQEKGLRSGTENTFGIVSLGAAAARYAAHRQEWANQMAAVRQCLWEQLAGLPGAAILSPKEGAPHILNVAFAGMRGEVLLHVLEKQGIFISMGSACSSKKRRQSRTHEAMGLSPVLAEGAVRFSFSPENTVDQAMQVAEEVKKALQMFQRFRRR